MAHVFQEVESLKKQGNEAFKAGKADLSGLFYSKAQARPWLHPLRVWRTFEVLVYL